MIKNALFPYIHRLNSHVDVADEASLKSPYCMINVMPTAVSISLLINGAPGRVGSLPCVRSQAAPHPIITLPCTSTVTPSPEPRDPPLPTHHATDTPYMPTALCLIQKNPFEIGRQANGIEM